MQLCLNEDDCETDVLGESVRMPFAFSAASLSLCFSLYSLHLSR